MVLIFSCEFITGLLLLLLVPIACEVVGIAEADFVLATEVLILLPLLPAELLAEP